MFEEISHTAKKCSSRVEETIRGSEGAASNKQGGHEPPQRHLQREARDGWKSQEEKSQTECWEWFAWLQKSLEHLEARSCRMPKAVKVEKQKPQRANGIIIQKDA